MNAKERQQGEHEQERVTAQTFLDWLSSQHSVVYELQRAEDIPDLKGRWDFVARINGRDDFIAIEIKSLVTPEDLRQFGDWSSFCDTVNKGQHGFKGSFDMMVNIPFTFDQTDKKRLVTAFVESLLERAPKIKLDQIENLGSRIAEKFDGWPTKPPTINHKLWREKHEYKVTYPPEDLLITKWENNGSSIELGSSVGQVSEVVYTLERAVMDVFKTQKGKGIKANEQLDEAKRKGASGTILLLDSHVRSDADDVSKILSDIAQNLLSSIDEVFLIHNHEGRVDKVWP